MGTFDLIGETLRRLRREKGMTLQELGRAAKLGRGQLSRIENNRQQATLASLGKLLASLGVSRQEFFRRYDLIEAERRREAGEVAAEENWPEQVREVVSKVESFVQMTFGQPRPIAQGAVEVADMVVLFRVMPKNPEGAAAAPVAAPAAKGEEKPAVRARAKKKPVGRPRKGQG